jgi:hypothetical protein
MPNKIALLLFLLCLLMSASRQAWSDPADIGSVEQALKSDKGAFSMLRPSATDEDWSKGLDNLVTLQTLLLDRKDKNKEWNPSNPKWKSVFDHIHTDFEAEIPALRAASKKEDEGREHIYAVATAAQIAQPDVDTLIAFYKSPLGQQYQNFIKRIDPVTDLAKAEAQMRNPPPSQQILTSEQKDRGFRNVDVIAFFSGNGSCYVRYPLWRLYRLCSQIGGYAPARDSGA